MSPWSLTYVTEYELVLLKHVNFTKWKKTSAIDFKPGLHKQRKPLRPIIGFDRTRGWGTQQSFTRGGYEMFQVVWSSVVHVFWCYSAFVVYISPILSLSCFCQSQGFYYYRNSIGGFHPPHSFADFDLKVFIFWQFMGWSYQKAGRFYPVCSWLQCLVCWPLAHDLSVKVCIGISHKIVILFFSVTVCVYIHLFAGVSA